MHAEEFEVEQDLLARYGELMRGEDLRRALGYRSKRTFARAIQAGTVPVPLVGLPNRRGRFARTRDVARWLSNLVPGPPKP